MAPVFQFAVLIWDSWSPSFDLQWSSSLYAEGHAEYETSGANDEVFDIDLRSEDDNMHLLAAGYMRLGHWSTAWDVPGMSYFQFGGVIHHLEMHNATLDNQAALDVVHRMATTFHSGAAEPPLCRACAPGSRDEDSNPSSKCVPCDVGT